MKKTILIILGILLAVGILLAAFFISQTGGSRIADGTYQITSDNSDAYITVYRNELQFHNIDLNALYQEEQLQVYKRLVDQGSISELTSEQLTQASDLNALFVTQPWVLNYDEMVMDKTGTFTYVYYCYVPDTYFGKVLQYDSLHKTIQINDENPEKVLLFKE